MDFVFGTMLTYGLYALASLAALFVLLFLLVFWRQRGTRKRIESLESLLFTQLQSADEKASAHADKQMANMKQTLTSLEPMRDRLTSLYKKIDSLERNSTQSNKNFQDSMMEIGFSAATFENVEADLTFVRQRMEQLHEELIRTHQWLDDFRILERVVLNLIGPDKLKTLIAKERSSTTAPPVTPLPHKKSLL